MILMLLRVYQGINHFILFYFICLAHPPSQSTADKTIECSTCRLVLFRFCWSPDTNWIERALKAETANTGYTNCEMAAEILIRVNSSLRAYFSKSLSRLRFSLGADLNKLRVCFKQLLCSRVCPTETRRDFFDVRLRTRETLVKKFKRILKLVPQALCREPFSIVRRAANVKHAILPRGADIPVIRSPWSRD